MTTIHRPYELRPMIRAGGPTVAVVPTCPIERPTCSPMCRYWRGVRGGEVECGCASNNELIAPRAARAHAPVGGAIVRSVKKRGGMGPGQDKAPIGKQALYGSRAKGMERRIKAPRVSGDRKPKEYRKICRRKVK